MSLSGYDNSFENRSFSLCFRFRNQKQKTSIQSWEKKTARINRSNSVVCKHTTQTSLWQIVEIPLEAEFLRRFQRHGKALPEYKWFQIGDVRFEILYLRHLILCLFIQWTLWTFFSFCNYAPIIYFVNPHSSVGYFSNIPTSDSIFEGNFLDSPHRIFGQTSG